MIRRGPLLVPNVWAVGPVLFFVVGLWITAPRLAHDAWMQWHGKRVTARVIDHAASTNTKHKSFMIRYKYVAPAGDEVISRSNVSPDEYNRYWIGAEIPIRTAPFGGWHVDRPALGARSYVDARFPVILIFVGSAFLLTITARAAWATLIGRPRTLERGDVTTGHVTKAFFARDRHIVQFSFEAESRRGSGRRRIKGTANMRASETGSFDVGDEVTVFYNRRWPSRSPVAYELCEFHIDLP